MPLAHRSAAAAALLSAACSSSVGPVGPAGAPVATSVVAALPSSLQQRVSLRPHATLGDGGVTVRSVLVNAGTAAVAVESRICGLDYAGSLRLGNHPAVLKCGAVSQRATLAPGDSIVTEDAMVVSSPAGQYVLRVRHALRPEGWAEVPVTVQAR